MTAHAANNTTPLLLWLDDQRPAPPGWTWARSVEEAIALILASTTFESASLDHWLGNAGLPTGMDLIRWMTSERRWPATLELHTSDPRAWDQMRAHLREHAPQLL